MKTTLSALAILFIFSAGAQQTATTEDGKKVLLHDNGKWEYAKENADSTTGQSQLKSYTRSAAAKTLAKSKKNNFAVWYDNKKWKIDEDPNNEASEFAFRLLKGDGYAMAITERIEIGMENFKEMALGNARNAAPDIEVEKEEDRKVNGILIKFIQMSGTIKGIKFTYAGYYCSNESGSIQLLSFTGKSLFKTYQKDFEELLNGLVVIEAAKQE